MTFYFRVPIRQLLDVLTREGIKFHVVVRSLYERGLRCSGSFPLAHPTSVITDLAVLHNSFISGTQMKTQAHSRQAHRRTENEAGSAFGDSDARSVIRICSDLQCRALCERFAKRR